MPISSIARLRLGRATVLTGLRQNDRADGESGQHGQSVGEDSDRAGVHGRMIHEKRVKILMILTRCEFQGMRCGADDCSMAHHAATHAASVTAHSTATHAATMTAHSTSTHAATVAPHATLTGFVDRQR